MSKNTNLIFIVAYNHEHFLEKVVSRVPLSVAQDPSNEILIIDDGSKDDTFYIGEKIKEKLGGVVRLTVLKNPVNQGYGGNQKLGYRYAIEKGFERVFLVHGDGQYAPELLDKLIARYDEADSFGKKPNAVFGTRMDSTMSPIKGGMPIYKFIGNKILTFIQNFILRSRMSEFHSGYRSYTTELLKRIPFEVNSNDFHFDTEIIIQCLASQANIVEVPIPTHYGDEVCHVNGMEYAWNILKACVHFRIQQFGFLYDQKFDIQKKYAHTIRKSPYSIHQKLLDKVPPTSKVLEVCIGTESIASALKEKECKVTTLSLDTSVDFNAWSVNFIDALKGHEFDFILLEDVLEHMPEPEQFLDALRNAQTFKINHENKYVAPIVLASTGNVAFFIVRLMLFIGQFNYSARGILDKTHKRLFTRKSFMHLFDQCGYKVFSVEGVTMPVTSVMGEKSSFALAIEQFNDWLAYWLPRFFAYQVILEAKPFPTTPQILEQCLVFSDALRQREMPKKAEKGFKITI